MKKPRRQRRQIFVFTPEEKKAAACVLGVLVLGLATGHYRSTHPRPAPPLSPRAEYAAARAARTAAARARSARGQADAQTARLRPAAGTGKDAESEGED